MLGILHRAIQSSKSHRKLNSVYILYRAHTPHVASALIYHIAGNFCMVRISHILHVRSACENLNDLKFLHEL